LAPRAPENVHSLTVCELTKANYEIVGEWILFSR